MMFYLLLIALLFPWPSHSKDLAQNDCRILKFKPAFKEHYLQGHVFKNFTVRRASACDARCFVEHDCVSFNVGSSHQGQGGNYICELSNSDHEIYPEALVRRNGFTYQPIENNCVQNPCSLGLLCQNGFTNKGYRCIRDTVKPQVSTPEVTPAKVQTQVSARLSTPALLSSSSSLISPSSLSPLLFSLPSSLPKTATATTTAMKANSSAINDCSEAPKTTGVHHILNHGLDPFPVYCDQASDGGGWTMVFKVVGGASPETVGQLWQTSDAHSENVIEALDTTTLFFGQYKNRIVMEWQTFQPREARVVLYENGLEVVSLKFDAAGTNNGNWFSQANLISSPWNDLKTSSTARFGIIGPIVIDRYFEISSEPYKGCKTDSGWMVVTHHPKCAWDTRSPHPSIQYSKLATKAVLNEFAHFGVADVLVVYVR